MPKRRQKKTDEPRELATSGALCLAFPNTSAAAAPKNRRYRRRYAGLPRSVAVDVSAAD